jgi:hypothetical protein
MFIKYAINVAKIGLYPPHQREFSYTILIIKMISNANNKKIWFTRILNPLIILFNNRINLFKDVLDSFMSLNDSLLDLERTKTYE